MLCACFANTFVLYIRIEGGGGEACADLRNICENPGKKMVVCVFKPFYAPYNNGTHTPFFRLSDGGSKSPTPMQILAAAAAAAAPFKSPDVFVRRLLLLHVVCLLEKEEEGGPGAIILLLLLKVTRIRPGFGLTDKGGGGGIGSTRTRNTSYSSPACVEIGGGGASSKHWLRRRAEEEEEG